MKSALGMTSRQPGIAVQELHLLKLQYEVQFWLTKHQTLSWNVWLYDYCAYVLHKHEYYVT